jgi:hypothetical protein
MKVSELNKIIEETISKEIKNTILSEGEDKKTAYCVMCEGEYIEICETKEEADQKCEQYNKQHPDKEYTVEMETYESKQELIDKMEELGEKLDSENMKKDHSLDELEHDQNEGNAFSAARAKAIKDGKKDFTVDGKTYPVKDADADEVMDEGGVEDIYETTCEKCGKQLCECGDMYEEESINETTKPKKIFRLTEAQLIDMISKMVNESIPGLSAVENAHKIGNKETKEHMANVDKKIKGALSIDGNDNPEFPKPIGKGEKMAVNNTEDMDEEMSMDRGENPLDLDYDHEPSDSFKERVKKALEGHSSMGNADGGNTIPSDTGKNIASTAEKRKKHKEDAPMYVKDVQPVNEGEKIKDSTKSVLQEEITKMKKLSSYNKKTQ